MFSPCCHFAVIGARPKRESSGKRAFHGYDARSNQKPSFLHQPRDYAICSKRIGHCPPPILEFSADLRFIALPPLLSLSNDVYKDPRIYKVLVCSGNTKPPVGRTKRRRTRKLDALEDLFLEGGSNGDVSVFERGG